MGSQGLAVNINDNNPMYLVDDTPECGEPLPDAVLPGPEQHHDGEQRLSQPAAGHAGERGRCLPAQFRYQSGSYKFNLLVLDDLVGYRISNIYSLSDEAALHRD